MSFKRFSKLLLVVLALALWAGTTYGQTLTPAPAGPFTLNYIMGGGGTQPAASQTFTISDSVAGPNTVSGLASAGLTFTCLGYVVDNTTPITCTIAVDPTAADALGVGPQAGLGVQLKTDGATDTNISVTLNVQPATALTATSPVALGNYTVNTGASVTANVTPEANYDGTVYTAESDQTWLTVTAGGTANTAGTGGSTQLTLSLVAAQADALPLGVNTAHIALKLGGVTSATVTVNVTTLAGATTLSSAPASVSFTYVKGSSVAPASQPSTITDTRTTDAYVVGSLAAAPWLSTASTNSYNIIAGTDTLTYSVSAAQAELKAVGSYPFNVTLTATNELPKTVVVTLNVIAPTTLSSNPTSLTFANYVKGGSAPANVTATISDTNSSTDTYTVGSSPALPGWLTCTPGTGSIGNGVTDTLTCSVVRAQADLLNAGPQSASVHLVVAGQVDALVTVNLTITAATSPLTSNPSAVTLTYLIGGGGAQASASRAATISSTDTAWDNYTVAAGLPNWLTVTPGASKAKSGTTDTATFALVSANVPSTPGTTVYTVRLRIDAFNADRTVIVTMNVVAQSMIATPSSVSLTYSKSGGASAPQVPVVSVLAGNPNMTFTLDAATVPVWLSVTLPSPATATVAGVNVSFAVVTAAASGMATGNYTANVGLIPTTTYTAHLMIPVTFTISNAAPGLTMKEGTAQIDSIWAPGMAIPVPTWTPISSNEPVPFTAACTVSPTDVSYTVTPTSCVLNNTSGVAYTWGYGLTATLDPALFASMLGNSIQVRVTVTPTGVGSAINLTYKYTLQPVRPTLTASNPTSAAHIPVNTSLVVLLTGTGFVGPGNIRAGSLSPTLVWLGTNPTPLAQSSYVVLSPTQLMVTIPETSFPTLSGGKPSNLAIGVANQTGISAPTAATNSVNLVVTQAPVIYAITNTASYVQPNPGSNPKVAPYEIISIFGDNFGPTGTNFLTAAVDSFNKVPSTLVLSGSGKTAVNLTVSFKANGAKSGVSAPILFVNQNQINTIVPAGMALGNTSITITSGTQTSDGLSLVTMAAADPGIFTLASDGVGQGAILNQDYSVNQSGNGEQAGRFVSLYVTGLGAPDSTALDMSGNGQIFSTSCIAISNTTKGTPGYMQVVNTAASGYTPPSPSWSTIDGAVIQASKIVSGLPPCMTSPVTVVIGPPGNQVTASGSGILYAGFTVGSVAGLYQISATIPAGAPVGNAVPVYVTIGSYTSPPVTMAIKP